MSKPTATDSRRYWWSATTAFVADALLLLAGVANVVIGTWQAYTVGSVAATAFLTAGLVLLLAANVDRFESLKGWGIEAKTRKLDETLAESQDTLAKLRRLTEVVGRSVIASNASLSRWETAPRLSRSLQTAREMRAMLKDMDFSSKTIESVLHPWVCGTGSDLAMFLRDDIRKAVMEARTGHMNAVHQIPTSVAESPERDKRLALHNRYYEAEVSTNQISLRPNSEPLEAVRSLQEVVRGLSGIEAAFDSRLTAIVDPWIPELQHLAETGDLKTPDRWMEYWKQRGV